MDPDFGFFLCRPGLWKDLTPKRLLIAGGSVAALIVFLMLIYTAFDLQAELPKACIHNVACQHHRRAQESSPSPHSSHYPIILIAVTKPARRPVKGEPSSAANTPMTDALE